MEPDPDGPHTGHLVGEYRLGPLVGSGGVGHVYRATHCVSGDVVAVKVVNRPATSAAAAVRFMREVQALRQASSPHVVSMLGWGVTDEGHHFLAMELLEGESLRNLLRREKRLEPEIVATMLDHVAAGLEVAHERGIVHRDIKPSNLFLARGNSDESVCWKILDFGLSKFDNSSGSTITKRHIVGTPGFLSPEQALGEPVDQRSDVFALATVAYCALTGKAPFWAEDPIAAVYNVVHRQPHAPSSRARLHADVDHALMLGLSKHVGDRFASATDFAQAFRAAAKGALAPELRIQAMLSSQAHPWSLAATQVATFEEAWQTASTLPTGMLGFHPS